MKVLVPIAGKSIFFDDKNSPFSKPLIEIKGKSMIQLVIENISSINEEFEFIFIVNSEDCKKFHLHNILKLLSKNCKVIKVNENTKGALCSILLGIKYINNEEELIICNGDQIIDYDFNEVLDSFRSRNADVGLITFNSVHPRWSYVRLDSDLNVIETAEKRPLSKNAIAGFYYFRKGTDFINGAMKSIQKSDDINGIYYIAPSINQLILENKKIVSFNIESKKYKSFYSPKKLENMKGKIVKSNIDEMKMGWFVGNFEPSLYKTNDVEVAVKKYKKGDNEKRHYHKIATEITVIVSGRVSMNSEIHEAGDIIVIPPFQDTDFQALEDTITTVAKLPGANNDKYIGVYEG